MRVMLEGKLRTMGKNPSSIQVVVDEQEDTTKNCDEEGLLISMNTNSPVPSFLSK